MNTLIIDKKKYVVVEEKLYRQLCEKAARKTEPIKKLTSKHAKKHAYDLIDKWAKGK